MLQMDIQSTERGDIHTIGRKWMAFHTAGQTAEIITHADGIFVYLIMSADEMQFEWIGFDENPEILMLWEGDNNWNVEEILRFCDGIFDAHTEPQDVPTIAVAV